MSYISPKFDQEAFNCPYCNAYAHQIWLYRLSGRSQKRVPVVDPHFLNSVVDTSTFLSSEYAASQCVHCKEIALWRNEEMIYPNATTAPLPDEDMPDDIKEDFNEARQVFPVSPRSSAALLRLVIQKLCKHLGYPGKDINSDIGEMVTNGLYVCTFGKEGSRKGHHVVSRRNENLETMEVSDAGTYCMPG